MDAMNPLDLAVLGVVLLSAFLAFARGFTREILSFAAWVGAGAVAWFAFPYAQPLAQAEVESKVIADALAIAGSFFVALLALSVLSHLLSGKVKDSRLSAVDRSLGFAFGVLRGAALVSLVYLFMLWLWPTDTEQPPWLRDAKARPLLAKGAALIVDLVPDPRTDEATREAKRRQAREARAQSEREALERLANPVPAGADKAASRGDPGYNEQERSRLEQLIQSNGSAPDPQPQERR